MARSGVADSCCESKLNRPLICTVGHSNRAIETFVDLLLSNQVVHALDVTAGPRSRHNLQFNRDELPASLDSFQIAYTHIVGFGSLRHTRADSPNTGRHNLSF